MIYTDYRKLLERWIPSAMEYVFTPDDRPDLAYYGTGTNVWGIQTHMKGFAAFAVLASDPDTDETVCGVSRSKLGEMAVAMLRFTLQSHIEGNYHCMDSETEKWGHHWLAALALERMLHGVEAIDFLLTDGDRELLRRVLLSEADWTTDFREVKADPVSPNVPESNLWSGALLHRVCMMYPGLPREAEYKSHGTALLLNSISVPSDAESSELYDGKPESEWFVGANYFESYGLDHHGYMNVGYMVICLSNIAMLHFAYKKHGLTPPKALYHNMEKLWRLVRSCIFDDGRLFRIGGDTRVRYCYCQDYLLPVFPLMRDALGDDTSGFERGWLATVSREMDANGDGSFLSSRCELFAERSPLYYTRLEADRACTISMLAYWGRLYDGKAPSGTGDYAADASFAKPLTIWHDDYHGSSYSRGEHRLAAFTWISAERPTGLTVPPSDSSMAEWRHNLTGSIEGNGLMNYCNILSHSEEMLDGGFVTCGRAAYVTSGLLEENDTTNVNCENRVAFCALPDGRTTVTLQYCFALRRCHLVRVKPLFLNIPNDIFNGERREYVTSANTVTIDGKLAVTAVRGGKIGIYHSPVRQIGLQHISVPKSSLHESIVYGDRGMLRCDELTVGRVDRPTWFERFAPVFDLCAVLTCVDGETPPTPAEDIPCAGLLRAVKLTGADGKRYILAANLGDSEAEFVSDSAKVTLAPCTAKLIF